MVSEIMPLIIKVNNNNSSKRKACKKDAQCLPHNLSV